MSHPQPPNPFRIARIEGAVDAAIAAGSNAGVANLVLAVVAHDPETGAVIYRGAIEATVANQLLAGVIAQQFAHLVAFAQKHGPRPEGAT